MTDLFNAANGENMERNTSRTRAIAAGGIAPFILRLPDAVIISLLEKWLTLEDIAKLDTAMTSQEYRPQLLDFMERLILPSLTNKKLHCPLFRGGGKQNKSKSPYALGISDMKRSCGELYWISLRNIYIRAFALVEVDDDFVETLAFPDLQVIYIFEGSARSIHHITNMSPKLTEVHLYSITGSVGIRHVAEHCPKLQYFTLALPKITNGGVVDELLFMFGRCLDCSMVALKDITFTDAECEILCQYGDLICDLTHVRTETELAMGNFIVKCPNLLYLNYFNSGDSTGIVLNRAAKTCRELGELLVDKVTTANIVDLSQNCPNLYYSQIYGFADDFTPSSLEHLSRNLKLAQLDFSGVSLPEEAVVAIAQLGSVWDLTCSDCEMGTCTGFRSFRDSPISKSLTRVHLKFSVEIDVDSQKNCIEGLAYCSKLDSITFDGGPIDDVSLILLCSSCPLLKYLNISIGFQRNSLSLDSLTQTIVQCKHLKTIKLTQSSVSDGVMSTRSTRGSTQVIDEFEEGLTPSFSTRRIEVYPTNLSSSLASQFSW